MAADFNHPNHAADAVMVRANIYRDAYYKIHRFWRDRSDFALGVIFVGFLGIGLTGKTVFQGDRANFRPWFEAVGYTSLALAGLGLSDPLRFSREGDVGSKVMAEVRINAAEDVIEQQAERKFHPFGSPQGNVSELVEIEAEQLPPEPPIEDLGASVSKSKLPVLVVGSTGSGKTTFLESVLLGIHRNFPGADVTFFDGKPTADRGLLGIKKTRNYVSVGSHNEIPRFYEAIDNYGSMLTDARRGGNSQKSFAIVDELNNAIRKARKFMLHEKSKDPKEQDKFNYVQGLQIANDIVISQGREKGCIGISTTHEATTEALGQGTGMRSNNRFAILGSKDSFDNIESILGGTGAKLIVNPDTIARLKEQYQCHKDLLFAGFFALTNVGGDWRIVRLPDFSDGFPDVFGEGNELDSFRETVDMEIDLEDGDAIDGIQDTLRDYAYKTSRNFSVSRIAVDAPNALKASNPQNTGNGKSTEEITPEMIDLVRSMIDESLENGETPSRTKIITAMGFKGRKYKQGCEIYERIMEILIDQ